MDDSCLDVICGLIDDYSVLDVLCVKCSIGVERGQQTTVLISNVEPLEFFHCCGVG